jgi:chromosome segregation ATPase
MSSSDTPALVRTTGLDPAAGSAALEAEASRLRRTVESLERQLAETEAALDERDRELAATREQLAETEADLERAQEWGEFLDRELRAQQARIAELEAEQRRQAERHERVVDRYEGLLAETEREEQTGGLVERLKALF